MSKKRILVVEDDKHLSKLIKYNMEKAGFDCITAPTGEIALKTLDRQPVDLIILDIMLPKMDGLQVCKQIKQDKKLAAIPIIMLTARGEEIDRIVGFELGADDYIVKPFSVRELVLRIKAILKRNKKEKIPQNILTADKLTIDISRHKVIAHKKEVELTLIEFKLLVLLMQRKGRVQSRDSLLNDVWDISSEVTTRTVDTHVKRLRQKLGKVGNLIETVRGIGYRFSDKE
ncbi:response regulator transcription factor [bacterium]|nr:response regulator transcription factor [bacterium]